MKKTVFLVFGLLLVIGAGAVVANAETAGVNAAGSATAAPGVIVYPSPMPPIPEPVPPPPNKDSGFLQFNELSVESVSGVNPPAEILAINPNIQTLTPTPFATPLKCYRFDTEGSASGNATACPTPAAVPSTPTTGGSNSTSIAPFRYAPYRIKVDGSTRLMLRDRMTATLADFVAGDRINVFGFYNTDGSIQAYLIRDLSKPVQKEYFQLNNAELVSISGMAVPTTLVVLQRQNYPCYDFGANGDAKASAICPMGLDSTSGSPVTKNLQVPTSLAPIWNLARKYVVNVDAQTVILNRNRTQLSLSNLKVGDELNIYGATSDNGQTIDADIVRDLSLPVVASAYSGTVTQVNADGSFVIQNGDGRMITVQSPIQVGVTVQLKGVLDSLSNVISQVSSIVIGAAVPTPVPVPYLRVQGSEPLPSGSGGTPNTQN
jgi:hypothetical protein